MEQCEFLHVISEIQKREYEKTFKKECRIFKKGLPFEEKNAPQHSLNSPIRFVYTGNIGNGRWETLADIGKVLKECNKDNVNAQLYIYSLTPLSKRMKEALEIPDTVFFMGGISEKEVKEVQKDADVLLHVEALNIKSRLSVHQSFSTKIVDYLHTGNCIFAVGTKDMASIDYLVRNKVAIVATNRQEIAKQIKDMLKEPEKILAYGVQGWDTGKKNHQKAETVKAFQADLESVLDWG